MRKIALLAALAISAAACVPASATVAYNFDFKSATDSGLTGGAGNSTVDTANGSLGTISVTSTAWNATLATSGVNSGKYVISSSYLGTYKYGLGVTSGYDNLDPSKYYGSSSVYDCANGDCGTHQIDNMGNSANSQSYDFIQLTFSQAVTLSSLTLNSFGTANAANNAGIYDTDFSYGHIATALTSGATYTSLNQLFGTVGSTVNGASVARSTCESASSGVCGDTWTASASDVAAGTASKIWLVAASVNGSYGGDGRVDSFKLASANVGAVPEPATWASMVMGFGIAGSALRRRRVASLRQA